MLALRLRILDESLAIEHEPSVEAADSRDTADHFATDGRQDLPEEALVTKAREDFRRIVRLAMVDRK